jgi:HEPN domain-containing protein
VLLANGDMLDDVVGFHAQQAVEKAVKVALVLADVDFPRSHDLRELTDIAIDNSLTVPDSIREARWLTPWAAQLRYEMLEPLDRDAALSVATEAVGWASSLFDD